MITSCTSPGYQAARRQVRAEHHDARTAGQRRPLSAPSAPARPEGRSAQKVASATVSRAATSVANSTNRKDSGSSCAGRPRSGAAGGGGSGRRMLAPPERTWCIIHGGDGSCALPLGVTANRFEASAHRVEASVGRDEASIRRFQAAVRRLEAWICPSLSFGAPVRSSDT